MKKKQTSLLKLMTTFVFAVVLCLGLAMPAFASSSEKSIDPTAELPVSVDHNNPKIAVLTKLLEMPTGTSVPSKVFQFKITKANFNGLSSSSDLAAMPWVGTPGGSPTDHGIISVDFSNSTGFVIEDMNGLKTIGKESASIFGGVTWTAAGVYTYNIEEIDGGTTINTPSSGFIQSQMVYSAAKYSLAAYVKEYVVYDVDGTTVLQQGFYVASVGAKITVSDKYNEGDEGRKVDVEPGFDVDVTIEDLSKMIFTNMYYKNNGGTDPTTDTVLSITKEVSGELASKQLPFSFTITVQNPATPDTLKNSTAKYNAYIMDTAGVPGSVIQFTPGTPQVINLKHGEKLNFVDLPVGASYNVVEAGSPGYTAKYTIIQGSTQTKTLTGAESAGVQFTTPSYEYVSDEKFKNNGPDRADFLNKYKSVTPTGISVDNLPYIMLIVIGAIAVTVFAVFRARRKETYNA